MPTFVYNANICLFVNNANIWWLLYSSRVSSSGCFGAHFVYVVLLCVVTFWVPCCHVRYDFHIKTVFGSSFPPVVCRRAYVFTLFMFLFICVWWCPTHIVPCFSFVFLRIVCPVLPVSQDYPFLIDLSVFSNVYFYRLIFIYTYLAIYH